MLYLKYSKILLTELLKTLGTIQAQTYASLKNNHKGKECPNWLNLPDAEFSKHQVLTHLFGRLKQ